MTRLLDTGAGLRAQQQHIRIDAEHDIDFRTAAAHRNAAADQAVSPTAAAPATDAPISSSLYGFSSVGDGFGDVVTAAGNGGHIKVFDGVTGASVASFFAFDPSFAGGARVATGDVNGDGRPDVIAGAGPGGNGHVKVFNGQGYGEIASFFAFSGFAGGVNVAAGDVNADGRDDIVVAAGAGGGPQVKVFDGATGALIHSFFAYDPSFTGGVFVSAGDFDGDGRADIFTGTETGSSHVKVFDGGNLADMGSFFAYGSGFTGGVSVAVGDVNGDARADLITGKASGAAQVKVFSGSALEEIDAFTAFSGFTGGIRVASSDVDADGRSDIFAAAASGSPQVGVFNSTDGGQNWSSFDSFLAYDPAFTGGVFVGGGDVAGVPTTVTGTSGDDLIHPHDDGVGPPPGYNDVPFTSAGNHVLVGGAGHDFVHGGAGIDRALYQDAIEEVKFVSHGGHALNTATEGADYFDSVEIFQLSNAEIYVSTDGRPPSVGLRMDGGSNELRVRTTGGNGVSTVDVNHSNPSGPAFEDSMRMWNAGRLSLVLGGGDNVVSVEGDLRKAGLDTLRVDASGGDNDTVSVVSDVVESLDVQPDAAGSLLAEFVFVFLADPMAANSMVQETIKAEKLEFDLQNLQDATISGDLASAGVASNTLILTTGEGDSDLDASGVTSDTRVVLNAAGGADTLLGGAGADILNAGSGDDELDGGAGKDELNGESGHDQLLGGLGNDKLSGGQGFDTLGGGDGKDKLTGGANADRLRGDDGADKFVFTKASDSTAAAFDRILDLAAGDSINLAKIDADTGTGGNQAFHIVGAFSGDAGELIRVYSAGQDRTYFRGDTDGDGTADIVIAADGNHTGFTSFAL